MKHPKELGVKIGNPEEVFWTDVQKQAEKNILQSKREIIIQQEILNLASKMIKHTR